MTACIGAKHHSTDMFHFICYTGLPWCYMQSQRKQNNAFKLCYQPGHATGPTVPVDPSDNFC